MTFVLSENVLGVTMLSNWTITPRPSRGTPMTEPGPNTGWLTRFPTKSEGTSFCAPRSSVCRTCSRVFSSSPGSKGTA